MSDCRVSGHMVGDAMDRNNMNECEHDWLYEDLRETNYNIIIGKKRTCRHCQIIEMSSYTAGRLGTPWMKTAQTSIVGGSMNRDTQIQSMRAIIQQLEETRPKIGLLSCIAMPESKAQQCLIDAHKSLSEAETFLKGALVSTLDYK